MRFVSSGQPASRFDSPIRPSRPYIHPITARPSMVVSHPHTFSSPKPQQLRRLPTYRSDIITYPPNHFIATCSSLFSLAYFWVYHYWMGGFPSRLCRRKGCSMLLNDINGLSMISINPACQYCSAVVNPGYPPIVHGSQAVAGPAPSALYQLPISSTLAQH